MHWEVKTCEVKAPAPSSPPDSAKHAFSSDLASSSPPRIQSWFPRSQPPFPRRLGSPPPRSARRHRCWFSSSPTRAPCHPGLGSPSPAAPVRISLLPDRGTSAAVEEAAAAGPLPSSASPARGWRGRNSWRSLGGQCTQLSATPARSRPRPAHSRRPLPPPGRRPSSNGGDPPAAGEARETAAPAPAPAPAGGEAAADAAGAASPPAVTPAPSGRTTTRASASVSRWCRRPPPGSRGPLLRGALQPPTSRPPPSPPQQAPPPPPPRPPPPAA